MATALRQDELQDAKRHCKLDDLLMELSNVVPGVTEYVRLKVIRLTAENKEKIFAAGNEPESGTDDEDFELMQTMLSGGRSSGGAAPTGPTVPSHSRVLEKPPADNAAFDATVKEAERKAIEQMNLGQGAATVPARPATTRQLAQAAGATKRQTKNAQAGPVAVHSPGKGAGPTVVKTENPAEFPSLGDSSLVGRTRTAVAASAKGSSIVKENSTPNATAMPASVPETRSSPQAEPRVYDDGSFTNGVIFKANNQTYGECLQRQLFGLPANQMTRTLGKIVVGQTALFLFNFQTSELEGVFVATAAPCMDLEPDAWTQTAKGVKRGGHGSPFPAQVRVRKVMNLGRPSYVDTWEHLVSWHNNNSTFDLDLDEDTTRQLIKCMNRPAA